MEKKSNYEDSMQLHALGYSLKISRIAVISDGSAMPGQGNIGGLSSLPIMEEKASALKEYGSVDAFPICLATQDPDEIVETIKNIAPGFGGILLDGISAPKCFIIEKRLAGELDIPVFHDSGSGTAVVIGASVLNAFKLRGKPLSEVRAAIAGAGAAGSAVTKMFVRLGIRDIVVCDSKGILSPARIPEFGEDKIELLEMTNKDGLSGGLEKAVKSRDLFVDVAKPKALTEELVKTMRKNPVVFPMTDRIDSALIYPGIFRGALDAGATRVTEDMQVAAARALAGLVPEEELSEERVLPKENSKDIAEAVAKAVADAWEK